MSEPDQIPAWSAATGVRHGDARLMQVRVDGAVLTNGASLEFPGPGVTAIVGANNSGKSTFLRQLYQALFSRTPSMAPVQLITSIRLHRSGSGGDLLAWLAAHASYRDLPTFPAGGQFFRAGANGLSPLTATGSWDHGDPDQLGTDLAPYLVRYADASSRLQEISSVRQRDDVTDIPAHSLHVLQDDAEARQRINELSERILRQRLTLDALSGQMRLRVGIPAVAPPTPDEGEGPYRAAMAQLPPLESQGDGMKSLMGLLLPLITGTFPIVLVDEPEAFLHPPQAFALGRALGEITMAGGLQLFLATHDRNLLAGLLASDSDLSVVRLTRQGDQTNASQLVADELKSLWVDPVLRYSNLLDGLFHQLVVLGEAESDCRFYAAALDVADTAGSSLIPSSDVLFLPAGGKAGMEKLAKALRAVSVPVAATPDLDILTDENLLSRLVKALGNDWSDLRDCYRIATQPFRQPRDPTRVAEVKRIVLGVLDAADPDARYDSELRDTILTALRSKDSPWQEIKAHGQSAFRGQAAVAATRLLDELDSLGVVTVRQGELENFARGLGVQKGKGWLPAALAAGAHKQPDVQEHVARILRTARPRPSEST